MESDDDLDGLDIVLTNLLSAEAEGQSLLDQRKASVKHFDEFLSIYYEEKHFLYATYAEILENIDEQSVEFFTPDLFGVWGDFLIKVGKLSWSTAHKYLSGLKGQIEFDFDRSVK